MSHKQYLLSVIVSFCYLLPTVAAEEGYDLCESELPLSQSQLTTVQAAAIGGRIQQQERLEEVPTISGQVVSMELSKTQATTLTTIIANNNDRTSTGNPDETALRTLSSLSSASPSIPGHNRSNAADSQGTRKPSPILARRPTPASQKRSKQWSCLRCLCACCPSKGVTKDK